MSSSSKPTINTYVSDMLALERHVVRPLERQIEDDAVDKYPEASRAIAQALDMARSRINVLSAHLETLGGHAGDGMKSGMAATLGAAAAAIGNIRKTEVSKYLRDDYAALALVSASYTLLHTTALAMGNTSTAQIAQAGLREVATSVIRLSAALPATVLVELRDEGVAIDPSVLSQAQDDVAKAWSREPSATA